MTNFDVSKFSVIVGGGYDFRDWVCSGLSFSTRAPMGDATASIEFTFPARGIQTLPGRYSYFEIRYDGAKIWTGLVNRRSISQWDGCSTGTARISAVGLGAMLSWRVMQDKTIYGPRVDLPTLGTTSGSSLKILTGEDAVYDAVSRFGGGLINVSKSNILTVGLLPDATSDFFLRTPQDVINEIAAMFSYLNAPIIWEVSTVGGNPTFFWTTRPTGGDCEYTVVFGDGKVKLNLDDNADGIFNYVVAAWGKNQPGAAYANGQYGTFDSVTNVFTPPTVTYSRIPYQKDKAINLTAEVDSLHVAQNVVSGLYTRVHDLEPGWSFSAEIPSNAVVSSRTGGTIPPWFIRAGKQILFNGLNPNQKFGLNHPPPSYQYITETRFDAKTGTTTLTCGDIQDFMSTTRTIVARSSHLKDAMNNTAISLGKKDASKLKEIGPDVDRTQSNSTGGSRQGFGAAAFDKKNNTIHPEIIPPRPMAPQVKFKSIFNDTTDGTQKALGSGLPLVNGQINKGNLIQVPNSTGGGTHFNGIFLGGVEVPIGRITGWKITADTECTCKLLVFKGSISSTEINPNATPSPSGTGNVPIFVAEMTDKREEVKNFTPLPVLQDGQTDPNPDEHFIEIHPNITVSSTDTNPQQESYCTIALVGVGDTTVPTLLPNGTSSSQAKAKEITLTLRCERMYWDSVSKKLSIKQAINTPGT